MDLKQTIADIDRARESIRAHIDSAGVYAFTQAVNNLGYFDYRALQAETLSHSELVQEAIGYLKSYLDLNPKDFVALNNLGVLLADSGERVQSRRLFRAALKLAPNDRNIHENLRTLDILAGKSQTKWHDVPEGAQKGERTLSSYFDPHGM